MEDTNRENSQRKSSRKRVQIYPFDPEEFEITIKKEKKIIRSPQRISSQRKLPQQISPSKRISPNSDSPKGSENNLPDGRKSRRLDFSNISSKSSTESPIYEEYFISSILDKRQTKGKKLEYLVKWQGYKTFFFQDL